MAIPVSVIIITYNEEVNLPFALKSVCGWADQVFVVDSFSDDRTVEIAKSFGAEVYQNRFKSYTDQRNWALTNLPLKNDWILFLDADEYLSSELKEEITEVTSGQVPDNVNGFFIKRKFYFLGKWIKHGDTYPSLIRLIRKGNAYYMTSSGFREKIVVKGRVSNLRHSIIHDDKKNLTDWIMKQCERASIDATEKLEILQRGRLSLDNASNHITIEESKRIWLRTKVFFKLPGPVRPFAQFIYRYIIKLGFMDGWPGFIYHFLLQFWYPLMVEAIYEELKYRQKLPDKYDVDCNN